MVVTCIIFYYSDAIKMGCKCKGITHFPAVARCDTVSLMAGMTTRLQGIWGLSSWAVPKTLDFQPEGLALDFKPEDWWFDLIMGC